MSFFSPRSFSFCVEFCCCLIPGNNFMIPSELFYDSSRIPHDALRREFPQFQRFFLLSLRQGAREDLKKNPNPKMILSFWMFSGRLPDSYWVNPEMIRGFCQSSFLTMMQRCVPTGHPHMNEPMNQSRPE